MNEVIEANECPLCGGVPVDLDSLIAYYEKEININNSVEWNLKILRLVIKLEELKRLREK